MLQGDYASSLRMASCISSLHRWATCPDDTLLGRQTQAPCMPTFGRVLYASPSVVVDGGQQQLVPQVRQRAADDAGVIAEQEAADAGKQRQHPHGARLVSEPEATIEMCSSAVRTSGGGKRVDNIHPRLLTCSAMRVDEQAAGASAWPMQMQPPGPCVLQAPRISCAIWHNRLQLQAQVKQAAVTHPPDDGAESPRRRFLGCC